MSKCSSRAAASGGASRRAFLHFALCWLRRVSIDCIHNNLLLFPCFFLGRTSSSHYPVLCTTVSHALGLRRQLRHVDRSHACCVAEIPIRRRCGFEQLSDDLTARAICLAGPLHHTLTYRSGHLVLFGCSKSRLQQKIRDGRGGSDAYRGGLLQVFRERPNAKLS